MKENSFLKLNHYIKYDEYLHLPMAITYTYFCIKRIGYYVFLDRFKICILRIINRTWLYFDGRRFDTGSLKLSLVCPTTRPNIILLSDRIDFGTCTTDVRHYEWLLVLNVTRRPVPLKISLPDPTGPFFCPFVMFH